MEPKVHPGLLGSWWTDCYVRKDLPQDPIERGERECLDVITFAHVQVVLKHDLAWNKRVVSLVKVCFQPTSM